MVVVNMFISVRLFVDLSYEVKGVDLFICGYFNLNFVFLKFIFKNVD